MREAITILISIMITVASIYIYHSYFAPKIVVLDITRYIQGVEKDFIEGKLNEKQLKEKLLSFKDKVESISSRNVVILRRSAVISGGEDITENVAR